jgi:AcrR family transcriptional regulator
MGDDCANVGPVVAPPVEKSSPRRPRISREFLADYRRRRYVDASAELLHEFGREGPTVTNIVRIAGTARNSYYEVFGSAEDCIGHGIDIAARELFATLDAQDGVGEWAAEVDAAIAGFYGAVAAEPILAELFLIHSAACRGDHRRVAARAGAEGFVALFERGRDGAEALGRRPPPSLIDECLALAVLSLAVQRVRGPEAETLAEEAPAMAALVVGYYLGPEAADGDLVEPAVELLAP